MIGEFVRVLITRSPPDTVTVPRGRGTQLRKVTSSVLSEECFKFTLWGAVSVVNRIPSQGSFILGGERRRRGEPGRVSAGSSPHDSEGPPLAQRGEPGRVSAGSCPADSEG
jgi:hypothetical protein